VPVADAGREPQPVRAGADTEAHAARAKAIGAHLRLADLLGIAAICATNARQHSNGRKRRSGPSR